MISDKDEDEIRNAERLLCLISKCSIKLYGNIVFNMQIEMINFVEIPASLAFALISEF